MSISRQQILDFLYREARLLDDREWDEWLTCYDPEATFWMPAWTDEDELTTDPQSQISLIYYPNREGLEDRVFRIKTERSSATMPETRTTHNITNMEVLAQREGEVDIRFNWHTLAHRYNNVSSNFGTSFYTLKEENGELTILSKKVVLKNDYVHQVIDVYHI